MHLLKIILMLISGTALMWVAFTYRKKAVQKGEKRLSLYTFLIIVGGFLFLSGFLALTINPNGTNVTSAHESLRDKPLSKQNYQEWKDYIDSQFQEWCDAGKEMKYDDLGQMYIQSAYTMERRIESNLQEFANLSQPEVDNLKQYTDETCKKYIDKIQVLWNEYEMKSKPNRYK